MNSRTPHNGRCQTVHHSSYTIHNMYFTICILHMYTINIHHNNLKSGNKSKMFYHERGNTVILNMHEIIELELICWLHNFQQPHATCRIKMISSIFFIWIFGWIWNLNRSLAFDCALFMLFTVYNIGNGRAKTTKCDCQLSIHQQLTFIIAKTMKTNGERRKK